MLQQPNVVCHAVAALGDGRQAVQDAAVQLPGIGLAADVEALTKAKVRADAAVHLVDFCRIPVKQLQEAGFRASGSPAAQKFHGFHDKIQLYQIADEVLHPQRCPLAHRDQLGGLIMGVAQSGSRLERFRETGKVGDDLQQLSPEVFQAVPVENDVGVIGDVAAGRAQMDDTGGGGRGLAVGIHVRHHVVTDFLFPRRGTGEVDVRDVGFQLLDLLFGDRQSQRMLGLGKRNPELPPGLNPLLLGKQVQHIVGSIPGA